MPTLTTTPNAGWTNVPAKRPNLASVAAVDRSWCNIPVSPTRYTKGPRRMTPADEQHRAEIIVAHTESIKQLNKSMQELLQATKTTDARLTHLESLLPRDTA